MPVEMLTYADLGERLKISPEAARALVKRHRWPRSRSNDGKTLVSSGPQGRVFEITADGKIVWEYWSRYSGSLGGAQGQANPFALFRAIRVPATHPVVTKRPLKPLDPQPALRSPE